MNPLMHRVAALFHPSAHPHRRWAHRALIGVTVAGLSLGGLTACGHGPTPFDAGAAPMSAAQATQWRDKMVERVSSHLSLDATQKQHLVALVDTMIEQRKQMMPAPAASGASAADPRAEFRALIAGPRFDAQAAQALVNRRTEAMKAASPKVISAFGTFYDSLRPEQQQKVREFMNQAGRHGHHGRAGGPGGLGGPGDWMR